MQERRLPTALTSFRHRNFQLWFGGQLISVIGTWMQIIAQSWLVYQISKSEFALGVVSFAAAIPVLIVSPWSGVVIDRVPKQALLVITQSTSMLMAFVLSVLTFTHTVQVWHIIAMATVLGIVNAFDAPARQSLVVELVGREDLSNAIALNSIMFNGARVLGPALGGLLLAALGAAWCFFINGLSFLAVIGGLVAMRFPPFQPKERQGHWWTEFMEGLNFARGRREIFALLGVAAVFNIFGQSYSAILPAFIDKQLHAGAAEYGTINAFIGIGAVAAAMLIAQYGLYGYRGRVMMAANLIFPVFLTAFAFSTHVSLSLLLSMFLGAGFMLLLNNANSLLQLNVEDNMRGRIMSLYTLSIFGLAPFGSLAMGTLGQNVPLNIAVGIAAALTFLLSAGIYRKVPEVSRMK